MQISQKNAEKIKKNAFLRLTFVFLFGLILLIANSVSVVRSEQTLINYIHFVTYNCSPVSIKKTCLIEGVVEKTKGGVYVLTAQNQKIFIHADKKPVVSLSPIGYEKYIYMGGERVVVERQV